MTEVLIWQDKDGWAWSITFPSRSPLTGWAKTLEVVFDDIDKFGISKFTTDTSTGVLRLRSVS